MSRNGPAGNEEQKQPRQERGAERRADPGAQSARSVEALYARRYDTGEPVRITLAGAEIQSVEPLWPESPLEDLPFVAPGLFDVQVNGFGGVWFSDRTLSADRARAAIEAFVVRGVTRMCPTLITSSFETLAAGLSAIRVACEQSPAVDRAVAGCHLEGPFLSPEDGPRGAHPLAQIRPADWSEFCELQKRSGNRIRLTTVAPEVPHAIEFIRRAAESGVVVAIGHTAAGADEIGAAVEAGARLSTHLGNGAHNMLPRHPNYIWDQLAEPRLQASLIADGHHLPASVVRSIIRAKGVQNVILTCDASGWAGCPAGVYDNELGRVEIREDGRIVVAGQDQTLAGSSATTAECVAQAVWMGAATLREAIDMACRNPSRLVGFREPRLMPGDPADLIVFRGRKLEEAGAALDIATVIAGGQVRSERALDPRIPAAGAAALTLSGDAIG